MTRPGISSLNGTKVKIYVIDDCPYCSKAVKAIESAGANLTTRNVTGNKEARYKPSDTVPQIIIGSSYIGGYSDLKNMYSLSR